MKRPYTDTVRIILGNDFNSEFKAGILYVEKYFPGQREELLYSKRYWNWFKIQYEQISMAICIDIGITKHDYNVNHLTYEALLEAYQYHHFQFRACPPFPPKTFRKNIVKSHKIKESIS